MHQIMHVITNLQFILSLTLYFSLAPALFHAPPQSHITSPSGRHQLPLAAVRRHLPPSATDPARRIYEHDRLTDRLHCAAGASLHARQLSPRVVRAPPAARYLVNGQPLYHEQGPVVRVGDSHFFVYDYRTGILLAGWGPRMALRPVDFARYPGVFVNVHDSSDEEDGEEDELMTGQLVRAFQYQNNSENNGHFRPRWSSERRIFFDVGLAFDASFCEEYTSADPSNSTTLVHGIGVAAHQMSLTPIVSMRIGDIVGFCEYKNPANATDAAPRDIFGPPSDDRIKACEANKLCTVPDLRLRDFRAAWRSYINDTLSDAVYLLTLSKPVRKGAIVGAAWVASACSEFGFGWVLGAHPVILAHEMGHSLGAPHSGEGLMQKSLPLSKRFKYKGESLVAIDSFIARLSGQACLVGRHQGGSGERRFSGFTRIVNPQNIARGYLIEGSDIAAGSVRLHGQTNVIMLEVVRYVNGRFGADLRMTTLSRSAEKGFPFTYNNSYSRQYVRASHKLDFSAGGGVAIANTRDDAKDDVFCIMRDRNTGRLYYIVGYDVVSGIRNKIASAGWSHRRNLPPIISSNSSAVAIGSDAGNMRGDGATDLVVAYIEHNTNASVTKARFVIGFDISGGTASATGGWLAPMDIPLPGHLALPTRREDIGDISVALWHKPSLNTSVPSTTSLLFAIIIRTSVAQNEWRTISCVLDNAQTLRRWETEPPSPIRCFIPRVKTVYPSKLTGGIALTRLLSATAPVATSVIYQNRFFASGSASQWIDVGDGILTREQAINPAQPEQLALSIGEDIIPSDTCARCYAPDAVKTCNTRVRSCFAKREFGKLDKVRAVRLLVTGRQEDIYPKTSSIFCAGFHSIFVRQDGPTDRCQWDAKRTSIIAEGLRTLIVDDITLTSPSEGEAVVRTGKIPEDLRYILGSGGFGANFLPTSVKVTVYSKKWIRWRLIKKALNKVKSKPDFNSFFDDSETHARIVRKGPTKFLVIITFKKEYQAEFLHDIAAGRYHDGQR